MVRSGEQLDLIGETIAIVDAPADHMSPMTAATRKVTRLLGDLETYVSGQSDIIIDYATARRCEEPISTAITESTVQWLLHRRMNAQQQMRWSPRGAHLMLKVRTSVVNGTLDRDHCRRRALGPPPVSTTRSDTPGFWTVSLVLACPLGRISRAFRYFRQAAGGEALRDPHEHQQYRYSWADRTVARQHPDWVTRRFHSSKMFVAD